MRAQMVNFERGQNPKDTIGLGFIGRLNHNAKKANFGSYENIPPDFNIENSGELITYWIYNNMFDKTRKIALLKKDNGFSIFLKVSSSGWFKYRHDVKDWEKLETWEDFLETGFEWRDDRDNE